MDYVLGADTLMLVLRSQISLYVETIIECYIVHLVPK